MPSLKSTLLIATSALAIGLSNLGNASYYPPIQPTPIPTHYWYIGGTAGVTISTNTKYHGIITQYQTANWDAGGELGLEYHSWRFELEYLFQPLNIDKVNGYVQNGGHLRVQAGLFNVLYDFLDEGDLYRPYIGAGVGYAFLRYPDRDSNSALGYEGQAGVRFAVYDNASFTLGYRYFGTTSANNALGQRFQNSLINAGFIYYFA